MTPAQVFELLQQTLLTALAVGGPIIVAALLVGLAVSVVQAATQINEATLSFAPKMVVVALVLVVGGPWMLDQLLGFTRRIFELVAEVGR